MNMEKYVDWLLGNRVKILSVWGAFLLVLALILMRHLLTAEAVIDNSVGVWFDLSDREIAQYDEYNTRFGEKEWTLLILKTESVYDPGFLQDLNRATVAMEALDNVIKVTSLTNVRDNHVNADDELDYRALYALNDSEAAAAFSMAEFRRQLAANPIFDKSLLNVDDERFAVVLIQNGNYIRDPKPYRIELVDGIADIVSGLATVEDWGLSGTTVVNAELNKAAQKDVIVFYLLVTVFLFVICWLILRNVPDLAIVMAMVVTSVLSAMAAIALLELPYNMATVMLPPILIALSVAGILHVLTDFHMAHKSGEVRDALVESLEYLAVPSVWAGLTTIGGLLSFGFSDVSPIFQLGVFAALGMAVNLLALLIIAPVLIFVSWRNRPAVSLEQASFVIRNGKRLIASPYVIGSGLVLVLAALYGLSRADVDTDYSKFFSADTRITHSYDVLREAGIGENPITLHLKVPKGSQYTDEAYFPGILAFEESVRAIPEVMKLLSVTDLVAEVDKAYNGTEGSDGRLAGYTGNQLSQLFLLAELSGNDDIDDFSVKSRGEMQIVVLTPYLSSSELRGFRRSVETARAEYLPDGIEVIVTGTTVLWANMDTQITRTQVSSLIFVGILLVVGLPLLFRSLPLGLFGVLINFLPLAASLGLMSWVDIKINMATVILGAISIGVVVDDTIHMFYRIQYFRNLGRNWQEAVEMAVETIGSSIYRTTIILITAFTCMATSDFLPTAHFGIFVSVSVLIALFLDLLVAPYVLIRMGKVESAREMA